MIHALIPEQVEMVGILAELREGRIENWTRLLRGSTYKEAISQGKSHQEAQTMALSPELARVRVKIEFV
jgi:hypothetical protein